MPFSSVSLSSVAADCGAGRAVLGRPWIARQVFARSLRAAADSWLQLPQPRPAESELGHRERGSEVQQKIQRAGPGVRPPCKHETAETWIIVELRERKIS